MILYHGTNVVFDEIDLTKSKPNKWAQRGQELLRPRLRLLPPARWSLRGKKQPG
jgi:hypothetical protein